MSFQDTPVASCDVLVLGGGGAGLRAAIEAREMGADVMVVSKSRVGYGSNTFLAKGAFAVGTGWREPRDNPEVHIKDTVIGGRFVNDQKVVATVAQEAGTQVAFLEKCGVRFRKKEGKIQIHYTPGHSYPRHVWGEHRRGSDFTLPLRASARNIGVDRPGTRKAE